MKTLFDDQDAEENDIGDIRINRKYARDYESRKAKQLEDIADDDSSSSSEEEDETGVLLTSKLDADIMKTVNALRSKDKSIYDKSKTFFEEPQEPILTSTSKDKVKKLKDVQREQILEQIEGTREQEEAQKKKFAYNQEQEEIRKAFVESAAAEDSSSDDENSGSSSTGSSDSDDLLVPKKGSHTHHEEDSDEEEFLQEIAKTEATLNTQEPLVDPKGEVQDGNKFLLDYFKNRAWIDKNNVNLNDEQDDDSDDNDSIDQLDQTDEFEATYNFRFEDMSGADLSNVGYARQSALSVRRPDETRKEKRKARKERKEAERRAKEEELKRLRNAKRKEMEDKVNRIKAVLGDVGEESIDQATLMKLLEGDYDPEQFEELMQQAYSDNFYTQEEKEWKTDTDVRTSMELDEDGKEVAAYDDGAIYEHEAEEEENWDEEEEYEYPEEEEDTDQAPVGTELESKVRKKVEEELYKLDYEDLVAGMPTRFKYKEVKPNNYGLSTEEILSARDSTLRQFVSLKKMAPYREEEHTVGARKRRRFREMLQQDLTEGEKLKEQDIGDGKKKKRRRKGGSESNSGKPKKAKSVEGVSDSRLASYNL